MTTYLTLNDVKARVLTCTNCGLSNDCRSPIPVQTRQLYPKYIVLGEAPGQVEDREGQPFVGPAGTFLKRALRKAGLAPSDGAYMNAVSCYPKADKTPKGEHVAACKVNLYSQLDVLKASHVLVCGGVALSALVSHAQISYASGIPIRNNGKVLFPVYHPAYILRSRQALEGWERDLVTFRKLVMGETTVRDVLAATIHCLYCNAQHGDSVPYCTKHEKWFRQDNVRTIPKRKADQPALF